MSKQNLTKKTPQITTGIFMTLWQATPENPVLDAVIAQQAKIDKLEAKIKQNSARLRKIEKRLSELEKQSHTYATMQKTVATILKGL